ncbi:HypC/HybG/HupF family hydrogenase formation chaperone [Archaeoglobus profundus]|uniref:Hydrogenase assembly chaperone hypC/hupF n=1 Tax=Archaeoglobus profundus (strain DSM 5631 / JCM 9629 / NBRC 100127 / Av18) TaxID=572546 RepID=D2RGF6_ARCPA|nr:HypC/HybG/HupF family hydrogenase formation chaperone [Archaeoglobus profundus]ADB57381.1 hydrogenase assembly chaperone hypC/hupF [Archaeoglobus profundus DSM 5631]
MCIAIPGKVVEIDYPFAVVDFKGTKRKIRIDLIDDLKVGDWVLVHVGIAIQKVDEEEARKTAELLEQVFGGL